MPIMLATYSTNKIIVLKRYVNERRKNINHDAVRANVLVGRHSQGFEVSSQTVECQIPAENCLPSPELSHNCLSMVDECVTACVWCVSAPSAVSLTISSDEQSSQCTRPAADVAAVADDDDDVAIASDELLHRSRYSHFWTASASACTRCRNESFTPRTRIDPCIRSYVHSLLCPVWVRGK